MGLRAVRSLEAMTHAEFLARRGEIPGAKRRAVVGEGRPHVAAQPNEVRHGTTTLFAALDLANGQVISRACARRTATGSFWIPCVSQIDRQTPPEMDPQLIVDNDVAHKHAKVNAWLVRCPRFHMHLTPNNCSWLNQVERSFVPVIERASRSKSFTGVRGLKQRIGLFVQRTTATGHLSRRLRRLDTSRPTFDTPGDGISHRFPDNQSVLFTHSYNTLKCRRSLPTRASVKNCFLAHFLHGVRAWARMQARQSARRSSESAARAFASALLTESACCQIPL